MSGPPLEGDTTQVGATSPRLFGVPVPLRAFGFAPGWRHEPIRGEIVVDESAIDLRSGDAVDGMCVDTWRTRTNVSALADRMPADRVAAARMPADRYAKTMKDQSEVAAA